VRKRFAISVFYCQLLCAHASFSQRSLTSFNQLTDLALGYVPQGLTVGMNQFNKTEIAVLTSSQPAIHLYEIASNGRLTNVASLKTQSRYKFIAAADLDGDATSEYIALSTEGTSLSVLRRSGVSAYAFEEYSIALTAIAEQCCVVDLNNDKRKDILLYGKTSSGGRVLLGQADGTFKTGPTLFPDVSMSAVATTDINADGISDILALNWLANQLTVYYGIGRLVYTEQVAVQLPEEPLDLAVTSVSGERTFRVAITLSESRSVHTYSGNSLGDYRLMTTVELRKQPAGVQFANLNGDQLPDLVVATTDGIVTLLSQNATTFLLPVVFGATRLLGDWALADVDGDRQTDCIMIDTMTRRLIALFNNATGGRFSFEHCVGVAPQGLIIGDFNGSGKLDIGVLNSGSASLSILTNEGKGRFSGQIVVPLGENPTAGVTVVPSSRRERILVISHVLDDRVTIMSLANDLVESKSLSVPTGLEPHVLFAKKESDRLQFVVRYRNAKDRSYLLSSFEQLNQRQFVERGFRSTLPTKILALNAAEHNSGYELLFATNDKRTTTISQALSEPNLEFKSAKPQFSYADSTAATRWILSAYINNDTVKDVAIGLDAPRNAIGIWFGKNAARDSLEWFEGVQPVSDEAIIIEDVNNDRIVDLVWLDGIRRAVLAMYGADRKPFRPPVVVAPAEGVRAIRVAPLRTIDELDLVLANGERGTVSVVMNPFSK
jgi:hypothetical protein